MKNVQNTPKFFSFKDWTAKRTSFELIEDYILNVILMIVLNIFVDKLENSKNKQLKDALIFYFIKI